MRTACLLGAFFLAAAVLAWGGEAETVNAAIAPRAGETFDEAAFILWLPEAAAPVRGIAVVLDGINVDGRHLAGRPQWQGFARDHALALVACYFRTDGNLSRRTYCEADRGSGRALLEGLDALGKASRHPELSRVPIVIMGFSAGGQFSYSFACFCPSRVAAFCSNKGGIYATAPTDEARQIPGLFIAGAKDTNPNRRATITALCNENRRLGARWCLAIEPNRGHQTGNANDLVLPFFDAVLRGLDRPAAERAGVVLDLDRRQLIPVGIPPKKSVTFWFPEEATIGVWDRFNSVPK